MKILPIAAAFPLTLALIQSPATMAQAQKAPAGGRYSVKLSCPAASFAGANGTEPGLVWREVISHPGATYIAVHFSSLLLGPSDYLRVSGDAGQPPEYVRASEANSSERWTRRVPGNMAVLELFAAKDARIRAAVVDCYTAGYQPSIVESVSGWNDLENIACYQGTQEYEHARAVARLLVHSNDGDYWGSGFLVSAQNHFLTAKHLISNSAEAASAEFEFMAEAPDCGASNCEGCYHGDLFIGSDLVKLGSGLDFALVRLNNGNAAAHYGFLELEEADPVIGEAIYIPQHPGGQAKEIAVRSDNEGDLGGVCHVQSLKAASCSGSGPDVGYYADTEGGSSGAPVLSRITHRVIAMHHCGIDPFALRDVNKGILSRRILEQVRCAVGAVTIDTTHAEISEDGGDIQVHVDGCSWTMVNPCTDWIQLPPVSGSGPTMLTLKVSTNYSCAARSCELLIGGNVFVLAQAAGQGVSSLYPLAATFSTAGGTGIIQVSGDPSCPWIPVSDSDWIVITGVVPDGQKITVSYAVAASSVPDARSGSISIAGWTHSVVQVSPPSSPNAGSYSGFFSGPDAGTNTRCGLVRLTSTAKGRFSATVQTGSRRYSASGAFPIAGTTTISLPRGKDIPLSLRLAAATPETLVGSIGDESWSADVTLRRAVYDERKSVCPASGSYSVVVDGQSGWSTLPAGSGWGLARVDRSGRVTVKGSLADGTPISQSASLGSAGEWPVYIPLYSGKSFAGGQLFIKTDREVAGNLHWVKPDQLRARSYPAGFEMRADVRGCPFSGPVFNSKVLPISDGHLILSEATFPVEVNGYFTLGAKGKVTQTGDIMLRLSFPVSSGTMTGRVLEPFTWKWVSFRGVVLQRWNIAAGYFLRDAQSGRVMVQNRENR